MTRVKFPKISPSGLQFSGRQKAVLAATALYVAFQIFFPFRHFLYPGYSTWTEEGEKFAWHMMAGNKTSKLRMFVRSSGGRQFSEIDLRPLQLDPRQARKMQSNPDMLLQLAHFLRDNYARNRFPDVDIRAVAWVSLNGRKPQLLVDPNVNLAAQPRNLLPKRWIMPLTESLRKEPWKIPPRDWEQYLGLPKLEAGPPAKPGS